MLEYKNVLIIDDDELSSSLSREILISAGYSADKCVNCEDLEDILESEKFEVFLIDLMMRGLTGLEIIRNLRERNPESIIIAITGMDSSEYYIKTIKAGADHFFNKPVNAEKLLSMLEELKQRIKNCDPHFSFTKVVSRAFDRSLNPIFITDDKGNLYFANQYFLDLAGITAERICRYNLHSLRFENALELSRLISQKSYKHLENRVLESRFLLDKAHEVWFNVIINPVLLNSEEKRHYFLFLLFDITRKKQMDNFILSNEEKFRSFISLSNDGMALVNEEGLVIEWNKSMTNITGVSIDKVYGEKFWDILKMVSIEFDDKELSSDFKKNIQIAIKRGVSGATTRDRQCRLKHPDGHIVYLQFSFFTIKMDHGYRLGIVTRDNTETVVYQKKIAEQNKELSIAYKQMEKLSRIDPLTQISNRRDIEIRLEYEKKRVARQSLPFSLAIGDIDNFKSVNDTYGHDTGDYVLQEIAKLVELAIREQDIFGRWGGEEFILVYPDTPLDGGIVICERLRKKIEDHRFYFKGVELKITLTIGVSEYSGGELKDTIKMADLALYEGKGNGKNRVVTI